MAVNAVAIEDRAVRRVISILRARPDLIEKLALAAELRLPDAWIGAGLIRNAVWDAVSDATTPQHPSDIDVVFFDPQDCTLERERVLEVALLTSSPCFRWSVKNQARMHERAGDPPYANTADAIGRWPETCTAIAARLAKGRVEILAPHGVSDLLGLIVRPTPAFGQRAEVFESRVREKAWAKRWPGVIVVRPTTAKAADEEPA
jgi:hypothetical protein